MYGKTTMTISLNPTKWFSLAIRRGAAYLSRVPTNQLNPAADLIARNPHLSAADIQQITGNIPLMPADEKRMKKNSAKLEKDLQRLCEQELSRRNIVYLHLSPMAREKQGWPDLVFASAGIPCAVELKSATGKLSDDQQKTLALMARNGWITAVIRTFTDFLAFLKANGAP